MVAFVSEADGCYIGENYLLENCSHYVGKNIVIRPTQCNQCYITFKGKNIEIHYYSQDEVMLYGEFESINIL